MKGGDRASIAIPIIVITVGVGWLLVTRNILPGVNWVWVLGLSVGGLLIFVVGGFNKVTIVLGPLLTIAGIFTLLRQTDRMNSAMEAPLLVIIGGVLALISRLSPLPSPEWKDKDRDNNNDMYT